MTQPPSGLPSGWKWTTVRDLLREPLCNGLSVKGSDKPTDVPALRLNAMTERGFDYDAVRYLPVPWSAVEDLAVEEGDFFVSRGNGSLALVGRGTLAQRPPRRIIFPDTMIRVRTHADVVVTKWLSSIWPAPQLRCQIETRVKTTAGIWKISQGELETIQVPLPPVQEQRRIVAELEKLFTRLDAGVAALKRLQSHLRRYRAAVLKAACAGRLAYAPCSPPSLSADAGETLLIELAPSAAKGRPRIESGPERIREARIPAGWRLARLSELVENHDGQRVPVKAEERAKRQGRYPYYGASGVIDHVDSFLFDGEFLLVAEDGANLLSRSTPIAFPATGKFWVNNHAHVLKPRDGVLLGYLLIALNATDLQFLVTGSAQPKLTQAALKDILIPLPPISEQRRILSQAEALLSVADSTAVTIQSSLVRADRLRTAILKSAIEGRLVSQPSMPLSSL